MTLNQGTKIVTRDPSCSGNSNPSTGEILGVNLASGIHDTHCDISSESFPIHGDNLLEIVTAPTGNTNNRTRDFWTHGKKLHKIQAWVYNGKRFLEHTVHVITESGIGRGFAVLHTYDPKTSTLTTRRV